MKRKSVSKCLAAAVLCVCPLGPAQGPQGPKASGLAAAAERPWFVAMTSYSSRIRLLAQHVGGGTFRFRAFNYQPGSLGTADPIEHPSYQTRTIGSGIVVVDGAAKLFRWDPAVRTFVCTASLPTSGSGHSVQFAFADAFGNPIFADSLTGFSIS